MPEQPGAGRLDPETLAAYIDGLLPPEERARVDAEIAAYPETYEWVVNSIGAVDDPAISTPAEPAREPAPSPAPTPEPVPDPAPHNGNGVERKVLPFYRRRSVQGLLGTLLAAAAALVMVVRTQPVWWQEVWGPSADPRFAKLVEAVGEERYIEARLTGGFKYGPLRQVTRGSGDLSRQNLQLLAAAGELQKAVEKDPSAENLHAWGVAQLVLGDSRGGLRSLEHALERRESWALLNDLAAARLAIAIEPNATGTDAPKALEFALRAARLRPGCSECSYNEALALELMGLSVEALAAWTKFVEEHADSPWVESARRHIERLHELSSTATPQPMVSPCIAVGLSAATQGLVADLTSTAESCLVTNPEDSAWKAYLGALADYYSGRPERARRLAERALNLPGISSSAAGRIHSVLGALAFARKDFEEAVQRTQAAQALLAEDAEGLQASRQLAAEIARTMGDDARAWRLYRDALSGPKSCNGVRRYSLLNSVALAALAQRLPNAAVRVLEFSRRCANGPTRQVQLSEAALNSARAYLQNGDLDGVKVSLDEAARLADTLEEGGLRSRLEAEVGLAVAEAYASSDPRKAIIAARKSVSAFEAVGVQHKLVGLRLSLARAHLASGDVDSAENQLDLGIQEISRDQAEGFREDLRTEYVDRVWKLFSLRADRWLATDNPGEALLVLERGRALSSGAAHVETLDALINRVPAGSVSLSYFWASEGLARWQVSRAGVEFSRLDINETQLADSLAKLLLEIGSGTKGGPQARALGRILLPQVEALQPAMVIVADGNIASVPFAALVPSGSDEIFAESVAVSFTPSVVSAPERDRRPRRSVAVGAYSASGTELPELLWGERESTAVATQYANRFVASESGLSAAWVLSMLSRVDVFHFYGHAVIDEIDEGRSRLVLPSEELSVTRLAIDVSPTPVRAIAVLAACSTAVGPATKASGPNSLAMAMLRRGAPAVIGTSWDIDDRRAASVFARLHQHLASGQPAAEAVRRTIAEAQDEDWATAVSLVVFEAAKSSHGRVA